MAGKLNRRQTGSGATVGVSREQPWQRPRRRRLNRCTLPPCVFSDELMIDIHRTRETARVVSLGACSCMRLPMAHIAPPLDGHGARNAAREAFQVSLDHAGQGASAL